MSGYLTFMHKDILNGSLTTPSGLVQYTVSTEKKLLGLKWSPTTVVSVSNNMTGIIDWARGRMSINGVEKPWNTLRHHVVTRYKEDWMWNETKYTLYRSSDYMAWTVRPTYGWTDVGRLEQRKPTWALSVSAELDDEIERMFVLLVLIFSHGIISYE
ncbi:hypothetical protein R3P38DRAFT_1254040 [Favolaschia claudopus]|uniref:Uncharacterized protein n=1 Tax=Favolaschia claudopus TaxID=2862362 RepID=A0AAW0B1R0_9AGAR